MHEHPLRCSVFVTILLRLFAIYWAVMAVLTLPGIIQFVLHFRSGWSWSDWPGWMVWLASPMLYGFFAMMAWIFGGRIGMKAAGAGDPPIPVRNVSRQDLFTFGILVTGLLFFLGNIGKSFNGLHLLAITREFPYYGNSASPFHELTSALIPCIAGLLLAIASPALGRKLARSAAPPEV